MVDDALSGFNIGVYREAMLFGAPHHVELLTKVLGGLYFIRPRAADAIPETYEESFFAVVALDFSKPRKVQEAVNILGRGGSLLAHKLIFAIAPEAISQEDHLLAKELGVRFVAAGETRNEDLRDYVKRVCVETQQVGSIDVYEQDIERAHASNDSQALMRVVNKLKTLNTSGEEVCRLIAVAYTYANQHEKAEAYLKKLLTINSQNLWAANALGRIYLKGARIAEAIEVLERLSYFHERNSERLLDLGNAYVNAGMADEAVTAFQKGNDLNEGQDQRFRDGIAKTRLVQGDTQGALALVGEDGFSLDVISFLNMRAIMSIRQGHFDKGMSYYEQALEGCDKSLVRAKVLFNMGLAYAKSEDLEAAKRCFEESMELGAERFQRAQKPLTVVEQVIKSREKAEFGTAISGPDELIKDLQWETLY